MNSTTIERVFGGVTYLMGAFSKYDFYSHLETFLHDLYGPVRFSFLSASGLQGPLRLDFTNHPGIALGEDPILPRCEALRRSLEIGLSGNPPGGPVEIVLEGVRVDVHASRRVSSGGRNFGWILFHDLPRLQYSADEDFGVEEFAFDHISFAYFRVHDLERLERDLDLAEAKLNAINRMGELIASLDVDVLLTKLLELSLFISSAQVGSVVLSGEQGVESRVEWGLPLAVVEDLRYLDGRPILAAALESGQGELLHDFPQQGRYRGGQDLRVDSYLCVPLVTKGATIGAINLINSSHPGGFSPEDLESVQTISGLAATAVENALLHRASIEKERITANLRVARNIQARMYPKECPRIDGYDMAWTSESCDETGGDYFDFIPLDDGSLAAVIGDVSGHGVGAALLMATGRASLRALFSVGKGIRDAMEALDASLERDMDPERFMTLFVGRIDPARHELSYVNAGHDHPLLFRRGQEAVEELTSTGAPLGVLGSASVHEERSPLPLAPGDVLLLVTDGAWEEVNPAGERFGKDRLMASFRRVAGGTAREIVDAIGREVSEFMAGGSRKDDFTMVAIKRTGDLRGGCSP